MKAAILAAGLGTRLRPLTEAVPKALMPVLNRPLLKLLLDQVAAAGYARVAVNTHHLGSMVRQFLEAEAPPEIEVSISHESALLGTGGGLKKMADLLGGAPFLALNGDILTDLDLAGVLYSHREEAVSTLVLHDCPPYNNVWVAKGRVVGIGGAPPQGSAAQPLAYTGIQVVGLRMLDYLPVGPYDLVTAWREAMAAGERLAPLVLAGHFWQDLGTPEGYLAAHRRLLTEAAPEMASFFPSLADPLLGPDTLIGPRVRFAGGVCLGAGVQVGAGATLQNTVVWDRARIAPQVSLKDCIVAAGVQVIRSAQGQVLA